MTNAIEAINEQTIKISDHGDIHVLSYAELLNYHKGDSLWGLSVAFRALQLAENLFSTKNLWNRNDLFIISSHPGPGVRDAIEYVTQCISHDRFRLIEDIKHEDECSSKMKYEWRINNGSHSFAIELRNDFVPDEFYELLDRLNTEQERSEDKKYFDVYKTILTNKIWDQPITSSYLISSDIAENSARECN